MREKRGIGLCRNGDWEELGGVDVAEAIIKIYYLRKVYFQKKEKKRFLKKKERPSENRPTHYLLYL